jgi:predicted acyltransferase (DUF342 family)
LQGKIFVGVAAAVAALCFSSGSVAADSGSPSTFQCNTTVTGGAISGDVRVPANGICILNGVTVTGNVMAGANAYFESNGSTISGSVAGDQALTLYLWNHTLVGGRVSGYKTAQVFVYDSTIAKSVRATNAVDPGFGHFHVCGNTIGQGVTAYRVGPDILVGDPAAGCGANTIKGDIVAASNTTDNELYVIGNNVTEGDIRITGNNGTGDKRVTGNSAHGKLVCVRNSAPFTGSMNVAAGRAVGQCAAATVTGQGNDDNAGAD